MAISVRCRWQVLVVVMAVARWVLPMVGAHPRVVQMMQDVITHKKWDYVTLLYTNNNHTMTTIEASEVLAGLVSSMSAAIIYLPNLQQLSLGFTYSGGDTWTNINIRQPHYRAQFITIWDNEGHAAAFMNKAGHLGLFTQQQEWLILLPHNTTIYDMENLLKDAEIFIDSETMPYESLVADQQLQNFREGYVVDVWHTLQEQLNFTYTATNTLFGSLQPDGVTWNGMVGMLQTDDADVAVAPLSITKIRSISIDFTIPIQIVSTRLYIRRPILEGTWTLYGQPFGGYLWMCIPVSIVVCAGMLWGLNWLTVYLKVNDHIILPLEALWIMFSGLVQQSTVIDPRPVSGKIVFFSGMWMGMILLTCYSAILVSILTTRQPKLPFKDFQALLDNPDWNLGVRTNTALADSLALAPPNSPMRLSWEHIVGKDPANNLPSNNDDALTNVLKGKYAFFANKEYIIYRLQRKLPLKQAMDIVDTNTDFLKRGIGFGLQKESPYKNLFNYVLTKMTQKGHLNRLKRKWWPNIDRNPDPHYPTPGFNEVFTLFIILGAGTILAVVFLMCEWFIYSKSRRVISWS